MEESSITRQDAIENKLDKIKNLLREIISVSFSGVVEELQLE